jgi:endonuclease/exonuclease/phosphatase (EEP) superfamily protein YafD
VPPVQLAYAPGGDGTVAGTPLPCAGGAASAGREESRESLTGPTLRILSWNLHKNTDPGWDADLARFAARSDLVLIQEAELTAALRQVLGAAGFDWLLGGSFRLDGHETGVLSAARVRPASACVQRFFEPLLQLPKATVIARYRVRGVAGTLAVANLHSINFTLGVGEYRAQLEAIAAELAGHDGPVIVAGDLNTWSDARREVVDEVTRRMGLRPVVPPVDSRTRFLGRQVDYVFVRGLEIVDAEAPAVDSSDHNPLLTTLRLPAAPR